MSMAYKEFREKSGTDTLKVNITTNSGTDFYFYMPAEAEDLINKGSFRKSGEYISYYRRHSGSHSVVPLHRELFYITPDHNKDVINHLNQIGIDNTYQNLDVVSSAANNIYKLSRGYITSRRGLKQVRRQIEGKYYTVCKEVWREDEACSNAYYADYVWLKEVLKKEYYQFDFFKYRRGELDILDDERTGKISADEAVYRHIMRYADNAWVYLRFGLQQYFKDNHIAVPSYILNEEGLMVDANNRLLRLV